MSTVDANQWVCTRCQTIVPRSASPVTRRRSTFWAPGRGILFGGGASQSSRGVCGYCGSNSIVPAGTPRGAKILGGQGIAVTGTIRRLPSIGCAGWIAIGIVAMLGFSVCSEFFGCRAQPTAPAARPAATESETLRGEILAEQQKTLAENRKEAAAAATLKFHLERATAGNESSQRRLAELYQARGDTNAAAGWLRAANTNR